MRDFAHTEKNRICGRYTPKPVAGESRLGAVLGTISFFIIVGGLLALGGMF